MRNCVRLVAWMIVLFYEAPRAHAQVCNLTQAATCVRAMEHAIGRVIETSSGVTKSDTLQELCLDVIKGNNLTQCYLQATGGCEGKEGGHTPSPTMQDWERVMQDLYTMCDGACPNFMAKTINITQCTSLIRFDDLFDNSYLTFCRSLNASLQCSREMSSDCPLFSRLFYDLLPRGVDATASTICASDCANFEEALNHLEKCKSSVTELPENLEAACSAYAEFRTCLQSSSMPTTCPMFGALMDVLYPQHIFGLYEEQCNLTDGAEEADRCGTRGIAKVDHCLRVLAQAWPVSMEAGLVSKQQCADFRTALRCVDGSGVGQCPNLRQYFAARTADKRRQRAVLDKACNNVRLRDVSTHLPGSAITVCRLPVWISFFACLGVRLVLKGLLT